MEITHVKHWSKSIRGENVQHVLIGYNDGDSKHVLHQFDKTAIAAPEFYSAFNNIPVYACKIMHVGEGLKNGIFVNDVTIQKSEDKEGNNTSVYKLTCRMKSGHANTCITITVQHKYIPEGFEQAINALIKEAQEYIGGKREQVDMFEKTDNEPSETPKSEDDQTDLFYEQDGTDNNDPVDDFPENDSENDLPDAD